MKEIFQLIPFYNDFHALVYLESDTSMKLVVNQEAVKSVVQQMNILRIVQTHEYILSHTHKLTITILELTNGYFVGVVKREYIWDYFQSTGITVVVATTPHHLSNFLNRTFIEKI